MIGRYKVSGYAFVPVLIEVSVNASDEAEAKRIAKEIWNRDAEIRRRSVVPGTVDEDHPHDFEPGQCELQ